MGEIKFKKKTLVEAINTTLQKTEQTAAEQSVATYRSWMDSGAMHMLPVYAAMKLLPRYSA